MQTRQNSPDLLANVMIASPCNIGWENMTGDEKARQCGECNKTVYDTSAMTAEEVLAVVQRNNVCLKLYRRADGTIIVDDCPKALRQVRVQIKAISKIVASICGFFIGCGAAFAQSVVRSEQLPNQKTSADRAHKAEYKADKIASSLLKSAAKAAARNDIEVAEKNFKAALLKVEDKKHDPAFVKYVFSQYIDFLNQQGRSADAVSVALRHKNLECILNPASVYRGAWMGESNESRPTTVKPEAVAPLPLRNN